MADLTTSTLPLEELDEYFTKNVPCEADYINCPNVAQWRAVVVYSTFYDGSTQQLLCDICKNKYSALLSRMYGDSWHGHLVYIRL